MSAAAAYHLSLHLDCIAAAAAAAGLRESALLSSYGYYREFRLQGRLKFSKI